MHRLNQTQCNVCEEWNDDINECDHCGNMICRGCFLTQEYVCEPCAWIRLEESLRYHIKSSYYRSDGRDFTEKDFVNFARKQYTIQEVFNDPITDEAIIKAFILANPKPPENENAIIGKIIWVK